MNEFAHKRHTCEFYLQQIVAKPYTCAVLNLNEKIQKIYWYKAPTVGHGQTDQDKSLPSPEKNETGECDEKTDSQPDETVSREQQPDPVLSVENCRANISKELP